MGLSAGFAVAVAAGCLNFDPFACQDDSECNAEAMGICQPVGYCSYPDVACLDSGHRFESNAGDGLGGECVIPMVATGSNTLTGDTTDSESDTDLTGTGSSGPDPDSSSDDGTTTSGDCGGGGQACCPGDMCDAGLSCTDGVCSCVQAVAVGDRHTCAIKQDGTMWCWGANDLGQLAAPMDMPAMSSTPVQVLGFGEAVPATRVAARTHTCATRSDDALLCWGDNAGQKVDPLDPTTPIVIPADSATWEASPAALFGVGGTHTCVARGMGTPPVCWGANGSTQLTGTPVDAPGPLEIGVVADADAVALGDAHTCMNSTRLGLLCWGDNTYGQLTADPLVTMSSPTPQTIGVPGPVEQVVSGQHHLCTLSAGAVMCWGRNSMGQLGNGMQVGPSPTPTPVAFPPGAPAVAELVAAADQTCAVMVGGAVYCWGGNQNGELLLPFDKMGENGFTLTPQPIDLGLTVASLSTGATHTCALTTQGQVMCWGRNSQGQIGDGTTADAFDPTPPQLDCP